VQKPERFACYACYAWAQHDLDGRGAGNLVRRAPVMPRLPVLIVPGWKDGAGALRHIERFLIANGWPPEFVTPVAFRDPCGSNLEHAEELALAIASARDAVGAPRVDVIAHSMAGLAVRAYLARYDRPKDGFNTSMPDIRRAVFLGTPHRGTWAAWLAWGRGAREMRPGSEFLRQLNRCPQMSAA
jgi:triacylglycerol esterase/lipase EstA (alpha/beta hydrolase family)